jgi:hypothetical protein
LNLVTGFPNSEEVTQAQMDFREIERALRVVGLKLDIVGEGIPSFHELSALHQDLSQGSVESWIFP